MNISNRRTFNLVAQLKDNGFPVLFFLWIAYGLLAAYLIESTQFFEIANYLFENFGKFIPSISRVEKSVIFNNAYAQLHASLMFSSEPLLFLIMLFFDFEKNISGVRVKKKEKEASAIFFFAGVIILFGGLNFGGPANIFRNTFFGFSLLSASLTFLSAYSLRAAFCLISNK